MKSIFMVLVLLGLLLVLSNPVKADGVFNNSCVFTPEFERISYVMEIKEIGDYETRLVEGSRGLFSFKLEVRGNASLYESKDYLFGHFTVKCGNNEVTHPNGRPHIEVYHSFGQMYSELSWSKEFKVPKNESSCFAVGEVYGFNETWETESGCEFDCACYVKGLTGWSYSTDESVDIWTREQWLTERGTEGQEFFNFIEIIAIVLLGIVGIAGTIYSSRWAVSRQRKHEDTQLVYSPLLSDITHTRKKVENYAPFSSDTWNKIKEENNSWRIKGKLKKTIIDLYEIQAEGWKKALTDLNINLKQFIEDFVLDRAKDPSSREYLKRVIPNSNLLTLRIYMTKGKLPAIDHYMHGINRAVDDIEKQCDLKEFREKPIKLFELLLKKAKKKELFADVELRRTGILSQLDKLEKLLDKKML